MIAPRFILLTTVLVVLGVSTTKGDEGMWLFNAPPKKHLKETYGFEPTAAWMEHLQRASVRFNSGGSGSFVSSDGLVLTNHHVGFDALQKLSTKDKDLVAGGFWAKTREEELKCLDLELNVLMSIEDVTERINAAVRPGLGMAEAEKARRAAMNSLEQESFERTGLRSDVITLYRGGLYHLYRYKKYTDVRLVFAPEQSIAFFGGDTDNFEYPRYDLDICFFRVYEEEKPAKVRDFLQWSHRGPTDGELVFVSGHPGHTDRADTVAHLEFLRDRVIPSSLTRLFRREVLLQGYRQRSEENARRAQDELFNIQNGRKAEVGRLAGLQDPAVMESKRREEKDFRAAVARHPKSSRLASTAWDDIAAAIKIWGKNYNRYVLIEQGAAFNTGLFHIARGILRLAQESGKPNADRLREYRQSNLDSVRQRLFSEAPFYNDLETVTLADSLSMYLEQAGTEDPLVTAVLAGKSPRDRAAELVAGTKLKDVAVRKQLVEGGIAAVEASNDPMLQLARLVDNPARAVRRVQEQEVDEPLRQAYGKIAQAQFAISGADTYPDATFTLRLAFGTIRGYRDLGQEIPPWTVLGGAYQHAADHASLPPFALPPRWLEGKDRLDLQKPMNFVSTADIIGGNSGSPVVNRRGEFVGIIFDGNLQSLVWDFVYSDKEGRAVSVHAAAIEEALRKLYGAATLADELGR